MVVAVAVVMVVLAARSSGGIDGAVGIWGFVLTAVGVVLGVVALWPSGSRRDKDQSAQVNLAERGDMFVSQHGDVRVNRGRRPPTSSGR